MSKGFREHGAPEMNTELNESSFKSKNTKKNNKENVYSFIKRMARNTDNYSEVKENKLKKIFKNFLNLFMFKSKKENISKNDISQTIEKDPFSASANRVRKMREKRNYKIKFSKKEND